MSYFAIERPRKVDAKGLFDCLQSSLSRIGIQGISADQCKLLIGIGTDGASANIARGGLKGLVEKEIPWLYWSWCLAHRVELAVKDALKGTFFDLIDEMLLRLYYIYEKSPKKCRELDEIITDLKAYIVFDDAGVKPIRASGSRWISHKLSAMKRVLSKFGAYTSHLIALSKDRTVKSADQAKLRGYCIKWVNAKYILGCAFFCDLLSPCAIFSKVLQLDILGAFTSLLRTIQELDKLSSKSLKHWHTYSTTCKSVTTDDDKRLYQQQVLQRYSEAEQYFSANFEEYCTSVIDCLRSRLRWTDVEFVRDVILFLATQGWQKLEEQSGSSEGYDEAIVRLGTKFTIPLEAAGVEIGKIIDEFRDMLSYALQFISLSSTHYLTVWWKLFHSPSSSDWLNVLSLARLLLTLPVSNGKLERVFSTMKNIKLEKRSSMSNELLDDLLTINIDKTDVKDFTADHSIDLWWRAKTRRPNQQPRKQYKKRVLVSNTDCNDSDTDCTTDSDASSSSDTDTASYILEDWDKWFEDFSSN